MSKEFKYSRGVAEEDQESSSEELVVITQIPKDWDVKEKTYMDVLLMPPVSKDESRIKVLMGCAVNLLQQTTAALTNNADLNNRYMSQDGFDLYFVAALKQLGNTLQYMVNCTSFDKGEVFSYDQMELDNRLEIAKNYLYMARRQHDESNKKHADINKSTEL